MVDPLDNDLLLGEFTATERYRSCAQQHFRKLATTYPRFFGKNQYAIVASTLPKLYKKLVATGKLTEAEFVDLCHEHMKNTTTMFSEKSLMAQHNYRTKTKNVRQASNKTRGRW